jgi:small subunit ribosomal protein S12
MTRIFQLIKRPRIKRVIKSRSSKLLNNPQKRAVCLMVLTLSPKKPNSANRRVSRIKIIETKQKIIAKIPGEGNNLQQHSTILVKGGRSRDLIGVRYSAIRGKYDLASVPNRKSCRSRYGAKKLK